MSIFKAYDIRGVYPHQLNEDTARKIAASTAAFIKGNTFAVGRDARTMSPSVSQAVIEGLTSQGKKVFDLGLCTTPTVYFAVGHYNLDAGIMITASHNPPEFVGLKICREKAIPIGGTTGLKEIESSLDQIKPSSTNGSVERKDVINVYKNHVKKFIKKSKPLHIAVDFANGTVGPFFDEIFSDSSLVIEKLCEEPDGRFPNHEPDPLKDENVQDLKKIMGQNDFDFGCAFDGDGDRAIFFESDGKRISGDLTTILLARNMGVQNETVVYDVRSSKTLAEEIRQMGGAPVKERVGHAFIKNTMRKLNAKLGGELSGHYYFKDNYFADSGIIAFANMISYLSNEAKSLTTVLKPLRRTWQSGEINFTVTSKDKAIEIIQNEFSDAHFEKIDGITIEYKDFWFNLRPSNTEPLLRLNLEANSEEKLTEVLDKITKIMEKLK